MNDFEKINIILAARDREFARAMDRNTKRVERFTRQSNKNLSKTTQRLNVMAIAGKAIGPVLAAIGAAKVISGLKSTVAALDDVGKTADKIGITTDALQEYRTIAESAGIAQGGLDSSLERFSKRLGEAVLGGGAANKMLKEMGLEAEDLTAMGLDKALQVIADKMALISDPAERAAKAAALFGREGVAMVNLMREGSAGMERMRAEARELGIVIDEDLIRKAEGAQTQLDLMGRVIDAQLNSALIEMAPLLVGAATRLAVVARAANEAAGFVANLAHPVSDLDRITENLVTAMGDEIRQSQLLEVALGNGIKMSVGTAKAKLAEVRSRYENVKAIIEERRALVLASGEWADVQQQINDDRAAMNTTGFPHMDVAPAHKADAYEAHAQSLANNLTRQGVMLEDSKKLGDELRRNAELMKTLEAGIGGAKGGIVDIKGTNVTPIENSPKDKIKKTGSAAGGAVPELTDFAEVLERVKNLFADGGPLAQGYTDDLQNVQALFESGELNAAQYAEAIKAIGDSYEDTKAAAKNMERATEQMFVSVINGSKSAKEAVADLLSQFASMALNSAFKGLFGGLFDGISGLFASANGNVFSKGSHVQAYADGGIVSGPTLFPMKGGQTGLMGEAGPEAIMPLTRINGKLGVRAAGGGGGVNITYAPVIDARGADAGAVARIETALQRAQAEFATNVVKTVRDAQKKRHL